jgi:presenilin-like A22 family membrane protease
MTALLSLISILSVVSVVPLILAISVVVMLLTGRAGEWYRTKNAPVDLPVGTSQPWS